MYVRQDGRKAMALIREMNISSVKLSDPSHEPLLTLLQDDGGIINFVSRIVDGIATFVRCCSVLQAKLNISEHNLAMELRVGLQARPPCPLKRIDAALDTCLNACAILLLPNFYIFALQQLLTRFGICRYTRDHRRRCVRSRLSLKRLCLIHGTKTSLFRHDYQPLHTTSLDRPAGDLTLDTDMRARSYRLGCREGFLGKAVEGLGRNRSRTAMNPVRK